MRNDPRRGWRPSPAWLAAMADAEEGFSSTSVGGLAADLGPVLPVKAPEAHTAFSRFIDLARRKKRLTVEALADAANVELTELLGILEQHLVPSTRTVYNLAGVLGVPPRRLLELSGLAEARDADLAEAAVRFAARSEPTAALTKEERAALDEFVTVLVERSDARG
jgi:HTH-type transcriptional regulator, competence development regulator